MEDLESTDSSPGRKDPPPWSPLGDTSEEEDLEGDERAKMEEKQVEIDETVKQMMDMEISQREAEGGREGFEEESKYCLEFHIWKTEKEWETLTKHEDTSTSTAADEGNKPQAEEEHREQENKINDEKTQAVTRKAMGTRNPPSKKHVTKFLRV